LDLTQVTVLLGAVITLAMIVITVGRQKGFDARDFYSFVLTFLASTNIPPSLFAPFYQTSQASILNLKAMNDSYSYQD
jgi:hypothetical protein